VILLLVSLVILEFLVLLALAARVAAAENEETDCAANEEDSKESEHINLKVTGQDGSVVHFKIKKNTPLRKLMGAYCNRAGIQTGVVRFRFDGNPINDEDTPAMLEMEDGDSIDVFQQQTGGCFF